MLTTRILTVVSPFISWSGELHLVEAGLLRAKFPEP